MNFNWNDYIEIADDFSKNKTSKIEEAYNRCIISRAYYAAYNIAAEFLRKKRGEIIPRERSHQYVIGCFATSQDPVEISIADNLKRLKTERENADYENGFKSIRNNAIARYIQAKNIISDINSL